MKEKRWKKLTELTKGNHLREKVYNLFLDFYILDLYLYCMGRPKLYLTPEEKHEAEKAKKRRWYRRNSQIVIQNNIKYNKSKKIENSVNNK